MDTILLAITDIKGNSLIVGHLGSIVLNSFSHGVSIPMNPDAANTERTLGRPNFMEFALTKVTDQATPAFYAACSAGTKLGTSTIQIGRNEGGLFMLHMKYTLTNTMVSHISTSGGGGDMSDSLVLNFTALTSEYTQQNSDSTKKGNASFGWDLGANEAVAPAAAA